MMGALLALGVFGAGVPAPVVAPVAQEVVTASPVGRSEPRVARDEVSIEAGGQRVSGWTTIRVTAGIERVCRDFDFELTERYPNVINALQARPGDGCEVRLGDDLVLTGYVNRWSASMRPDGHSVQLAGRSRTQDLVDCSAEWPGLQMREADAETIAQNLASAYGIEVKAKQVGARRVPQFNLNIGETAFAVIDRTSRYAELLPFDDETGALVLDRAGTVRAAGGLGEGANVQACDVLMSDDARYDRYRCFIFGSVPFQGTGSGGNFLGESADVGMRRPRGMFFVAEAVAEGLQTARRRAEWEMNRRIGRAAVIRITTDSWRDAAGDLWRPNTLVTVNLPSLKIDNVEWLIAEVTYLQSIGNGTTCDLTIMAPEAFLPQPISAQSPFVNGAMVQGGGQ